MLYTFISDSCLICVMLSALVIGALLYVRIPQVHENKISPTILNLFKKEHDTVKKNLIFHKAGGFHAPENTLEAVQQVSKHY